MQRLSCLFVLMMMTTVGCMHHHEFLTTVPEEDIPRIRLGFTLDELRDSIRGKTPNAYNLARGNNGFVFEASLEKPLQHWFTVEHEGEEFMLVSAVIMQPNIYFILLNDRLSRIIHPSIAPREGDGWDSHHLMQLETITTEELVIQIKTRTEEVERYWKNPGVRLPFPGFWPVLHRSSARMMNAGRHSGDSMMA